MYKRIADKTWTKEFGTMRIEIVRMNDTFEIRLLGIDANMYDLSDVQDMGNALEAWYLVQNSSYGIEEDD